MSNGKSDPAVTILDAALETILADKISGARLRQVARRSGMSQGNLHYYYPTKDELFQSLLDHLLEIFVDERAAHLADDSIPPEEKLRFFFRQQIDLVHRAKEVVIFFDFWVQGTKDAKIRQKIQQMYARWREDIQAVIDQGAALGSFSTAKTAQLPALLASIMDGASLQHLIDENAIDLEVYFDTAYAMVMNLLLPERG